MPQKPPINLWGPQFENHCVTLLSFLKKATKFKRDEHVVWLHMEDAGSLPASCLSPFPSLALPNDGLYYLCCRVSKTVANGQN